MKWHFEKKRFFEWCAQNGVELPKRVELPNQANKQDEVTQPWNQELANLIADRESDSRGHAIRKVISDLREAAFDRILKTDQPCAEAFGFCCGMDALESLSMTLFDMQEPDLSWVRDADDALEQLEKHVSDDALAADFQRLRQNLCLFVNCVSYFNDQFQWVFGDVEDRWRAQNEEQEREAREEREVLRCLLEMAKADRSEEEQS